MCWISGRRCSLMCWKQVTRDAVVSLLLSTPDHLGVKLWDSVKAPCCATQEVAKGQLLPAASVEVFWSIVLHKLHSEQIQTHRMLLNVKGTPSLQAESLRKHFQYDVAVSVDRCILCWQVSLPNYPKGNIIDLASKMSKLAAMSAKVFFYFFTFFVFRWLIEFRMFRPLSISHFLFIKH